MSASTSSAGNAWTLILALCLGTYLICMAYVAVRGFTWRGYGNSRSEILALSGVEQANFQMS